MQNEYHILARLLSGKCLPNELSRKYPVTDIMCLEDLGFIVLKLGFYQITDAGRKRFVELADLEKQLVYQSQQETKQEAKEKRRERRTSRQFWAGLFLGWLLGGFTPKEVWEFFLNLFNKMFH